MTFTSKQRAYLRGLANNLEPVLQVGKEGTSPEVVEAVNECFNTRELIKLNVLKNCQEDVREVARKIGERTHSDPVCCIGRRFVLYKPFPEESQIRLPK